MQKEIKAKVLTKKVDEQELLRTFEVEELEQRFEMGWIKGGEVSGTVNSDGSGSIKGKLNF